MQGGWSVIFPMLIQSLGFFIKLGKIDVILLSLLKRSPFRFRGFYEWFWLWLREFSPGVSVSLDCCSKPELDGYFSWNAVPFLLLHPSPLLCSPSLLRHSCSNAGRQFGGTIQPIIFFLLILHGKGNRFFPSSAGLIPSELWAQIRSVSCWFGVPRAG